MNFIVSFPSADILLCDAHIIFIFGIRIIVVLYVIGYILAVCRGLVVGGVCKVAIEDGNKSEHRFGSR